MEIKIIELQNVFIRIQSRADRSNLQVLIHFWQLQITRTFGRNIYILMVYSETSQ